jgi:methionyl-tRNA formyltransferase
MKKCLDIVFMGTPEFAVPSLFAVAAAGHRISLVVTQPDRGRGRGKKLAFPPVKAAAVKLNLDVVQVASLGSEPLFQKLVQLSPDLLVVVAFGHILSGRLLDIPALGAVNVHASLLPKYRGPAPIQWAVINGETHTGVTTMRMDAGMDTGDILLSESTPIFPDDTAATVHDRLAQIGAALLVQTIDGLGAKTLTPIAQDHGKATYAPMLKKEDGRINWSRSAAEIEAFIRGMTPWPGAFTYFDNRRLKLFSAKIARMDTPAPPGTIIPGFDDELRVATGDGALSIDQIQANSGKRMGICDFLHGCCMLPGTCLH